MESGRKLLRFVNLLDQKEQLKAFEEVFGDPKVVEKALEEYSRNFTLAGGYLNSPASTDEKEFKSRRMSAAETEAELASYHLWSHQRDLARPLIEQALKEDPKLGLAHEDLAFLNFAEGWQGPDHDEALELWNSVPAAERPGGEAMIASVVAGTQVAEGTVKSVHCGRSVENEEQRYTLVVEQGGHELAFQPKDGFTVGYSDTLSWGRDHFSSCLHINGVRAVVHYRPSADPKYAGELARLDLRDEVLQAVIPQNKAESSPPEKTSSNK